jgi:hypothetical protein
MRGLIVCILLVSLAATVDLAKEVLPLDVPRIEKYGCSINRQDPYWRVVVWADYKDSPMVDGNGEKLENTHDYGKLYSMRESRRKALEDCDAWMTETAKEIALNAKGAKK